MRAVRAGKEKRAAMPSTALATALGTPRTCVEFRKVHGAGNDFIFINGPFEYPDLPGLARDLCTRQTGIGADGLVISTRLSSDPPTYEVRCLNADGSEATMCGNALRCAAWCAAADHGHTEVTMDMAGVRHRGQVQGSEAAVTAEAGPVHRAAVAVDDDGQVYEFDAVHTGTEHAVTFVADVDAVDAARIGSAVRYHDAFAPAGTNVSFVQPAGPGELRIRTYERGVEAETLSCGSGAVAAVIAARARQLTGQDTVTVHNRAEEPLTVRPDPASPGRTFWVSGPAAIVFTGQI
ncbi:MAG: diaminopimelate epimerase [Streptosporangiaceae bacterium]